MSTQAEVNAHAYEYILYYIGVEQKDSGVYPSDLSGICTLEFAPGDTIVVANWTLGGSYPAPLNEQLLAFSNSSVLSWYNGYYVAPIDITNAQYYKISGEDLSLVRTDDTMIGYKIFDTTVKSEKIWNGANWGATTSSVPSFTSCWSSSTTGVTFTANTPKLIDVSGFTQTESSGNDWVLNTSTGKLTYNGNTRAFHVTIEFETTKVAVLFTQTLTTFISKNGSTSISGKRIKETSLISSISETNPRSLTNVITLSYGDTIQLGGSYTATIGGGGISFSNVSYAVSGC